MAGYGWTAPNHCSGTFQWVPMSGGMVPPGAVKAGQDSDGGPIFVGRGFHNGDILPAKVCPTHGGAFTPYGGDEITLHNYEVLVSDHTAWRSTRGGEVPSEAIRAGHTSGGEPLFIGRTMHDGTLTPGKVHPSHGCLYISYAGSELSFPEYEILILV